MNGTSPEFELARKGNGYVLTLILPGRGRARWYMPNPPPARRGERGLAVGELPYGEDPFAAAPPTDGEPIDRGPARPGHCSGGKIEVELCGRRVRGRYLLLVPSWGRETARALWVVINLSGPKRGEEAVARTP